MQSPKSEASFRVQVVNILDSSFLICHNILIIVPVSPLLVIIMILMSIVIGQIVSVYPLRLSSCLAFQTHCTESLVL